MIPRRNRGLPAPARLSSGNVLGSGADPGAIGYTRSGTTKAVRLSRVDSFAVRADNPSRGNRALPGCRPETKRKMASYGHGVSVAPVPAHLRREALGLVFGDVPAEERNEMVEAVLAGAEGSGATLAGLMGAWAGEELLGAVFAQVYPGRTAAVWLPRLTPDTPANTAHALMAAVCRWLPGQDVVLAQALLATVPEEDRNVLEAARFTHLAELLYLAGTSDHFQETEPADMLQFVPAGAAGQERLAALVEATYEATRDCAALDGVRPIGDVLAGYRALGDSGANEWFLVQCRGGDVGCLILADYPRQGHLELVYMGVLPAWRGRAWGIDIAQWAQWRARVLGRAQVVLAVDAANGPALAAYAAAGFRAWDQRSVYIRTLGS